MSAVETIQRALELASDGKHRTVAEIKQTFNRERLDDADQHLSGASIKKLLQRLIAKTHAGGEI